MDSKLLDNPSHFARVCEFNFLPAAQIDRGHVAEWMDVGLFDRLAACPRGNRSLSRFLLTELIAAPETVFDFEDPRRRLCLFPGTILRSLRDHVAAALSAEDLRRVVDRPTRTRLVERLGKPLLEFAEKRAPFLLGPNLKVYEEEPSKDAVQRFEHRARMCLSAWFDDLPEPLVTRVRLKLPPPEWPLGWVPMNAATHAILWQVTEKIGRTLFGAAWNVIMS